MNEQDLVENWAAQKMSHNFRRLRREAVVEFEFKGHFGHPSSYSFVRFAAQPADELSLAFEVQWPTEFDEIYTKRIKHTLAEAVLDSLWATKNPFRGCQLRLIEFKWDAVGGSEMAAHVATLGAMKRLVDGGDWADVTSRYRAYA